MFRTMMIAAVAAGAATGAVAKDVSLSYKFMTKTMEGATFDAPHIDGHSARASNVIGFATFEDGRVAIKEFVAVVTSAGATGQYSGYSTYSFENGDKLKLSFEGGWDAEGSGGDYTVIGGEGAFKDATGTGRFDVVDSAWEGWTQYVGHWDLSLPGS